MHMAVASAIGLVSLGGGTLSLSNDPASVAALMMAFYPRYPRNSSDNRYHLQVGSKARTGRNYAG